MEIRYKTWRSFVATKYEKEGMKKPYSLFKPLWSIWRIHPSRINAIAEKGRQYWKGRARKWWGDKWKKEKKQNESSGKIKGKKGRRGLKANRWRRTESAKRVNKRKKKGRWCWQRDRCEKPGASHRRGYASYLYRGLLSCKLGEAKKSGKEKRRRQD